MMVKGSQFCIHKMMHSVDDTLPAQGCESWSVAHVPSGLKVRGNLSYTEARRLLEKIESAELPLLTVDGNSVKPEKSADQLKALARGGF